MKDTERYDMLHSLFSVGYSFPTTKPKLWRSNNAFDVNIGISWQKESRRILAYFSSNILMRYIPV